MPVSDAHSVSAGEFTAAMAPLGPFEAPPRIAAAVSGGADSMALAVLADGWVRQRGGNLLALVVDHALRPESADEAAATVGRLGTLGIAARLLTLEGLTRGPALAERARAARFAMLHAACMGTGILHLLLGHHAGDQAETLLIRSLAGSGPAGMAGILPLVELAHLRLLRPLLGLPPIRLRATLAAVGAVWVEDPSNADTAALRSRLRTLRRDMDCRGPATVALAAAAAASGRQRAEQECDIADDLAEQASLRPEGFAVLCGKPLPPRAFAALLQTIGGSPYPPATRSVAALAGRPAAATLAGVRLLPAGRLGDGLLVVREAAAMERPIPALPRATWDRRFRLGLTAQPLPGVTLGALGQEAAQLRQHSPLPSVVLQTLPAFRFGSTLLAVPHLHYPDRAASERFPVLFSPPRPAVAAPFPFGDA